MLRFTLALLLASLTACAIAATGLFYVPGAFTPLSEVVEQQEVVAPFRSLHTSHTRDASLRPKMRAEIAQILMTERGGGDPRNVAISLCDWNASRAGKNLADIAVSRGLSPTVDNAADVVLWIVENGSCGGIFHAIGEEDVVRVMAHPATMIASDGGIVPFGVGAPHPRSYGTFARVLGVYVREKKVITLEDAVRKITSYPASRLGLLDRGLLRVGMKADVVVFDPATVKDMATYEKPHQNAVGFGWVVVNGEVVFEGGGMTGSRAGRVVYGSARAKYSSD